MVTQSDTPLASIINSDSVVTPSAPMAPSLTGIISSSWILDSGATDHITSYFQGMDPLSGMMKGTGRECGGLYLFQSAKSVSGTPSASTFTTVMLDDFVCPLNSDVVSCHSFMIDSKFRHACWGMLLLINCTSCLNFLMLKFLLVALMIVRLFPWPNSHVSLSLLVFLVLIGISN
ncbi:uncharacterized protein LOC120179695 [Hibiscus syriacus]|uniref:uncharacterized protein LOC120179695 n=1 Tax=Hibiscus syriacus TaxID=106335 RepID=UPI001924D467|nr:uncharacterized protein LOC120179695 [Hibiscus syriacus]